jgi:alkyldihydroxyacetonephosphate synthase
MPNEKVMELYEGVEHDCREEIIKNGGSISHHHGVGKLRKRYVKTTMTDLGITF